MDTLRHKTKTTTAPFIVNQAEVEVIRALGNKGKNSRKEITELIGWSKAKTSNIVQGLIDKGYLVEIGEGISEGGRKPLLLKINNQIGYLLGLDIGATSVDMVLADVSGKVFQRKSIPADVKQAPEEFLNHCCELLLDLITRQGAYSDQVLGIGVGVPGPVDFARGVLVSPPLMYDWENFPIRRYLQHTFKSAYVVVDNDVNIMALGEQNVGDGIGIDNFIFVKIGTGIGAGIISNGKIHRGSTGCAGDIGHICVDKEGPICRCGNAGCLEAMAASPAITEKAAQAAMNGSSPVLKQIMEENGGIIRSEDVNAACRTGDLVALEIIRDSGRMIGDVLAGLVNFHNPSHIFLGGGVTNFGNQFLVSIRKAILGRSTALATRDLVINISNLGAEAGVSGAIALAREYLFIVDR